MHTCTYICLYRGFVLVREGLCSGSFVRGFLSGRFCLGWFCPSPLCHNNRKLQTSKAPLKSQAHGPSLFTSAASNQRVFPKNSPWEAQVRLPEGERMRQIRGVFQRIVRGKLRSGCQKVRGGRLGVKAGVV